MSRSIILSIVFLFLFITQLEAQMNECRQTTKRFPSPFSHMTSDYANLNIQADILPKRFLQFESSFSLGSLPENENDENYFVYNSNLLRVGLGGKFEVRGMFSIPGRNVQINNSEINSLHTTFGLGIKANILSESSNTPGVGVMVEYLFYDASSHFQACFNFDKMLFEKLKLSFSVGPQFTQSRISNFSFSSGIIIKDRNKRLGVYALASNRYEYLQNIIQAGLVYSDNLNYQLTVGFGVHESQGLVMVSYSGLLNYRNVQRKLGTYF